MKVLFASLLFNIIIGGCTFKPDNKMNDAAVNISEVFIRDNIQSSPSFRIEGSTIIKISSDSTYFISGRVEGFTSYNAPVDVKYFTETVHYLGGNPNDSKSWKCIEIYVGNKKIK